MLAYRCIPVRIYIASSYLVNENLAARITPGSIQEEGASFSIMISEFREDRISKAAEFSGKDL